MRKRRHSTLDIERMSMQRIDKELQPPHHNLCLNVSSVDTNKSRQSLQAAHNKGASMSLLRASFCVFTFVLCLLLIVSPATTQEPKPDPTAPYLNARLPLQQRVDDLISRMTLEEKVSQMMNAAPAISRLGIPQYDWWNEA